ncbi:UNVERIFIED_CONTAM: hypothetical protein NCL1_14541 [Trichonephila clavipes]
MLPIKSKNRKYWYRHAYANKKTWNQSDYGAAFGKAGKRERVSSTVVRLVTAASMAGYHDLSKFERGVGPSSFHYVKLVFVNKELKENG